ncbi:hypothetical protein BVY02_01370 [bacterium J17]|nr:hypothetical protein BVY02_01370 [bacterium J17]
MSSFMALKLQSLAFVGLSIILLSVKPVEAQVAEVPDLDPRDIVLGEEYDRHRVDSVAAVREERDFWESALYYLPNRIIDFVDIFRVDVGVGPSFGAVLRVTEYGQIGYREMVPLSVRIGLRGREVPFFVEHTTEFGIGPTFLQSHEREVTPLEVGVGGDAFIGGAYLGVSIDEAFDFVLGILGIDFKNDDY